MRIRNEIVLAFLCLAGCCRAPVVTKGTFTTSYTLTMQRGSVDVLVQTSGPASYTLTNHSMNHPMGRRPDTEATFVTPAGTFAISDRNLKVAGLTINGAFYPELATATGRSTITIDPNGVIMLNPPKVAAPQGNENEVKKARLKTLYAAYQAYEVSKGEPAKKIDDLALAKDDVEELKRWLNLDEPGMSLAAANRDDLPKMVMVYEKEAPTDGGKVMFYDGAVKMLSAEAAAMLVGVGGKVDGRYTCCVVVSCG